MCKFCEEAENNEPLEKNSAWLIQIHHYKNLFQATIDIECSNESFGWESIEINFCPMCGCELKMEECV